METWAVCGRTRCRTRIHELICTVGTAEVSRVSINQSRLLYIKRKHSNRSPPKMALNTINTIGVGIISNTQVEKFQTFAMELRICGATPHTLKLEKKPF